MNFLAIDTSGARLAVAAYNGGDLVLRTAESEMKHSVLLMDETDAALKEAGLSLSDCDFLAAVVGPGSFTGIRIGVSAVKGMCFAAGKPALALTSSSMRGTATFIRSVWTEICPPRPPLSDGRKKRKRRRRATAPYGTAMQTVPAAW